MRKGTTLQSGPRDDGDGSNLRLMKTSGQTDQERLFLRQSQRQFQKQLAESGCDLDVARVNQENNEIFESLRYPREALLDADNLNVIARLAVEKLILGTKAPHYDADRLIRKLKSKFRPVSGRGFDWVDYSNQYGVWASAIPAEVSFLNGPLAASRSKSLKVKKRAKRAPTVEEECEEEEPGEVEGHMERTADQLSAVEESLKVLHKTLRTRVCATFRDNKRKLEEIHGVSAIPPKLQKKLKKHGVEIDAIRYLFNPKSFTQTVENIFHYSFLVKSGKATLKVKKRGFLKAPGGVVCRHVEDSESSHPSNTQAVLSLTMQDWRDLCQAYKVTKGDIPHRTGSLQTKTVNLSLERNNGVGETIARRSNTAPRSSTSPEQAFTRNSANIPVNRPVEEDADSFDEQIRQMPTDVMSPADTLTTAAINRPTEKDADSFDEEICKISPEVMSPADTLPTAVFSD